MNYFQKTIEAWQTVIFFALVLGSVVFIGSVFGLNGYSAETKFLIISNNQAKEYPCGSLGKTMEVVFREKEFYEILKNKFSIDIPAKNIHLKHYQKTDIIKIDLKADSIDRAQKNINKVFQAVVKMAPEYYPPVANIGIKTLEKPQVVDNFNLSLQRGGIAFLVGLIIGFLVVGLTDFRLRLFSGAEKMDRSIVSQKLKQELNRANKQKILEPEIEEYVFQNGRTEKVVSDNKVAGEDDLVKYKKKEKKRKEKNIKREKQEKRPVHSVGKVSDHSIEVHEISLNTFKSGLQEKKRNKSVVPDNLPVFVDDVYNEELTGSSPEEEGANSNIKDEEALKSTEKENAKEVMEQNDNEEQSLGNEQKAEEDNPVSTLEEVKIKKRPSAHNIANGFAPDQPSNMPNNEELTTEEIKERLNKLLRGDL